MNTKNNNYALSSDIEFPDMTIDLKNFQVQSDKSTKVENLESILFKSELNVNLNTKTALDFNIENENFVFQHSDLKKATKRNHQLTSDCVTTKNRKVEDQNDSELSNTHIKAQQNLRDLFCKNHSLKLNKNDSIVKKDGKSTNCQDYDLTIEKKSNVIEHQRSKEPSVTKKHEGINTNLKKSDEKMLILLSSESKITDESNIDKSLEHTIVKEGIIVSNLKGNECLDNSMISIISEKIESNDSIAEKLTNIQLSSNNECQKDKCLPDEKFDRNKTSVKHATKKEEGKDKSKNNKGTNESSNKNRTHSSKSEKDKKKDDHKKNNSKDKSYKTKKDNDREHLKPDKNNKERIDAASMKKEVKSDSKNDEAKIDKDKKESIDITNTKKEVKVDSKYDETKRDKDEKECIDVANMKKEVKTNSKNDETKHDKRLKDYISKRNDLKDPSKNNEKVSKIFRDTTIEKNNYSKDDNTSKGVEQKKSKSDKDGINKKTSDSKKVDVIKDKTEKTEKKEEKNRENSLKESKSDTSKIGKEYLKEDIKCENSNSKKSENKSKQKESLLPRGYSDKHLSKDKHRKSSKKRSPSESDRHNRVYRSKKQHRRRHRSKDSSRSSSSSNSSNSRKDRLSEDRLQKYNNHRSIISLQMGPLNLRDEFLLETESDIINPEDQLEESFKGKINKTTTKNKRLITEKLQLLLSKTKKIEEKEMGTLRTNDNIIDASDGKVLREEDGNILLSHNKLSSEILLPKNSENNKTEEKIPCYKLESLLIPLPNNSGNQNLEVDISKSIPCEGDILDTTKQTLKYEISPLVIPLPKTFRKKPVSHSPIVTDVSKLSKESEEYHPLSNEQLPLIIPLPKTSRKKSSNIEAALPGQSIIEQNSPLSFTIPLPKVQKMQTINDQKELSEYSTNIQESEEILQLNHDKILATIQHTKPPKAHPVVIDVSEPFYLKEINSTKKDLTISEDVNQLPIEKVQIMKQSNKNAITGDFLKPYQTKDSSEASKTNSKTSEASTSTKESSSVPNETKTHSNRKPQKSSREKVSFMIPLPKAAIKQPTVSEAFESLQQSSSETVVKLESFKSFLMSEKLQSMRLSKNKVKNQETVKFIDQEVISQDPGIVSREKELTSVPSGNFLIEESISTLQKNIFTVNQPEKDLYKSVFDNTVLFSLSKDDKSKQTVEKSLYPSDLLKGIDMVNIVSSKEEVVTKKETSKGNLLVTQLQSSHKKDSLSDNLTESEINKDQKSFNKKVSRENISKSSTKKDISSEKVTDQIIKNQIEGSSNKEESFHESSKKKESVKGKSSENIHQSSKKKDLLKEKESEKRNQSTKKKEELKDKESAKVYQSSSKVSKPEKIHESSTKNEQDDKSDSFKTKDLITVSRPEGITDKVTSDQTKTSSKKEVSSKSHESSNKKYLKNTTTSKKTDKLSSLKESSSKSSSDKTHNISQEKRSSKPEDSKQSSTIGVDGKTSLKIISEKVNKNESTKKDRHEGLKKDALVGDKSSKSSKESAIRQPQESHGKGTLILVEADSSIQKSLNAVKEQMQAVEDSQTISLTKSASNEDDLLHEKETKVEEICEPVAPFNISEHDNDDQPLKIECHANISYLIDVDVNKSSLLVEKNRPITKEIDPVVEFTSSEQFITFSPSKSNEPEVSQTPNETDKPGFSIDEVDLTRELVPTDTLYIEKTIILEPLIKTCNISFRHKTKINEDVKANDRIEDINDFRWPFIVDSDKKSEWESTITLCSALDHSLNQVALEKSNSLQLGVKHNVKFTLKQPKRVECIKKLLSGTHNLNEKRKQIEELQLLSLSKIAPGIVKKPLDRKKSPTPSEIKVKIIANDDDKKEICLTGNGQLNPDCKVDTRSTVGVKSSDGQAEAITKTLECSVDCDNYLAEVQEKGKEIIVSPGSGLIEEVMLMNKDDSSNFICPKQCNEVVDLTDTNEDVLIKKSKSTKKHKKSNEASKHKKGKSRHSRSETSSSSNSSSSSERYKRKRKRSKSKRKSKRSRSRSISKGKKRSHISRSKRTRDRKRSSSRSVSKRIVKGRKSRDSSKSSLSESISRSSRSNSSRRHSRSHKRKRSHKSRSKTDRKRKLSKSISDSLSKSTRSSRSISIHSNASKLSSMKDKRADSTLDSKRQKPSPPVPKDIARIGQVKETFNLRKLMMEKSTEKSKSKEKIRAKSKSVEKSPFRNLNTVSQTRATFPVKIVDDVDIRLNLPQTAKTNNASHIFRDNHGFNSSVENMPNSHVQVMPFEEPAAMTIDMEGRTLTETCIISFLNQIVQNNLGQTQPVQESTNVYNNEVPPYNPLANYYQTQSINVIPNAIPQSSLNYVVDTQVYPPICKPKVDHNQYPLSNNFPSSFSELCDLFQSQSFGNYSQNLPTNNLPIDNYVLPNIEPLIDLKTLLTKYEDVAEDFKNTIQGPTHTETVLKSTILMDPRLKKRAEIVSSKHSSSSSVSNFVMEMSIASPSVQSEDSSLRIDNHVSDHDDLSSCSEFQFDPVEEQDPFLKYPDAPRPQYEHIVKTEVHISAVGKRFEYSYLKSTSCNCVPPNPDEIRNGKSACDENCFNRQIKVECNRNCPVYELCTNRRFQEQIYSPLEPFYSGSDKGWGVRAQSFIDAGTFVIEYVGELIDFQEFLRRINHTESYNRNFLMIIQNGIYIDAGYKGNWSRFVNHSCNPNTVIERWVVNGKTRIGLFTKKPICKDEEITIDYQFQQYGSIEQKCFCASSNCTGIMGKVNEKLREQIKISEIRQRNELIQRIISRNSLKEIRHVSEMVTVIKEDCLDRDTFVSFLEVLLRTTSHLCMRTFIECGGLNVITSYLDSVAWNDWPLKLLYMQCLDHFKLKKRTLIKSGYTSMSVVENWSENPRFVLKHVDDDSFNVESTGNDDSETISDSLMTTTSVDNECLLQFVLPNSSDPVTDIEKQVQCLALSMKEYFNAEKARFFIPKIKGNQLEFSNDLSTNDSESKSMSIASSVQGDFVQTKQKKLKKKCSEVIQKLSKEEFRRLFSERYHKSVSERNQSQLAITNTESDAYTKVFQTIKELLSNVITEEVNKLRQNEQFSTMPIEFQNLDIDKILSGMNIIEKSGLLSLTAASTSSESVSSTDNQIKQVKQDSALYSTDQLPPNWRFCRCDNGRVYFYHIISKKTQWDTPVYPWDAGDDDPSAYDYGDVHRYQVTLDDINEMYERLKMTGAEQKQQEREMKRKERTIQKKLSLSAGDRNKVQFSREVFKAVKTILKPYFSSSCKVGRIRSKMDMKYLCEKFSDTVISKEVKQVTNLEDLELNSNVQAKMKSYIVKYMARQGHAFKRSRGHKSKQETISHGSPNFSL